MVEALIIAGELAEKYDMCFALVYENGSKEWIAEFVDSAGFLNYVGQDRQVLIAVQKANWEVKKNVAT
ncbi:MAG: hypothetical protein ACRCZS_02165 [Chroococcidiopsis sp.]